MADRRLGLGLGFFIFLSIVLLTSVFWERNGNLNQSHITETDSEEDEEKWDNPLNQYKLLDDREVYKEDVDSHIDEIFITIFPPSSDDSVSFEELNTNYNEPNNEYLSDAFDPVSEIFFESKKSGEGSIADNQPNATIEIRGQSSRRNPQKSYKIKLHDDTELWNGLKTINLNKHFSDELRIKNKLSFDYFEIIPDFVSLRTRFVKLYIKDLSLEAPDEDFKSFGLYTFIEQPNRRFLKRHGLDRNGNLYKAEFFEFFRYQDNIKVEDDITFDRDSFEVILEVIGNNKHDKLIEMLDGVNDYNRDINEVVDKYFDRDNLLTWLGVNILFDNYDTSSRNFLIYSPVNSDKWFFIPWDYDGTWSEEDDRGKWQKGIAKYKGMVLFNRFFKDIKNIEALNNKIEDLVEIINEQNTKKFLDSYYDVVKRNVFTMPDAEYVELTPEEYDQEYYSLVELTEKNRQYHYESLENPMPFFLGEPAYEDGKYNFSWQPSYDIQGDDLTYHFTLSTDHEFKNIIAEDRALRETSFSLEDLKAGEYFWRVIVYDSKGNWQEAFDDISKDGVNVYSTKSFIVR